MKLIIAGSRSVGALTIIHGGQTGVDRGAHDAATELGWPIAGYMPKDGHDEIGPIPVDVARHLKRCIAPGFAARTESNLDIATALLVVVRDKQDPYATPGTKLTLDGARRRNVARLVTDPSETDRVGPWIQTLAIFAKGRRITLMVAGPRASRWADGCVETVAILRRAAAGS